ncbi:MAG: ABC transporter permease [Nitrospirota bacterium]|jgi:putative ABC transport system permease protein
MGWNLSLALRLALRSIAHHRMVASATVLGVAIGVSVVAAILVVDFNTSRVESDPLATVVGDTGGLVAGEEAVGTGSSPHPVVTRVRFERRGVVEPARPAGDLLPTQEGALREGLGGDAASPVRRGEEDYQAMRLAVRLASLLSFLVGTVIVFYTMRFSVVSRARELCLTLCLGEFRRNVALSLTGEALMLGAAGSLAGLAVAIPIAAGLLAAGISTTGRAPPAGFVVPWGELTAIGAIAVGIALLGVLAPVRHVYRMEVARVLQPRFLSGSEDGDTTAVSWLIPPLLGALWLAVRPFLQSWLSVVSFFLFEAAVVLVLTGATLWWTGQLLRAMVRCSERTLRLVLPLETLLAARHMAFSGRRMGFAVVAVTLVFSLLTALHGVTRALQDEVYAWAEEALLPYGYFERRAGVPDDEQAVQAAARSVRVDLFRLSAKAAGEFPIRLIRGDDVNPWLQRHGRPPLRVGTTMLSRTLAARFGLHPGDHVVFSGPAGDHRFEIIDVADDLGFFAEDGQYVDLKSYALFSDGNPVFAGNLETTLGEYAVARPAGPGWNRLKPWQAEALTPWYRHVKSGRSLGRWQVREIDRDFLIFDFVLLMTVILASIGVTNTMLIQVRSRQRELAVLRTVGIGRWQVFRMLLLEGGIIGIVGAGLALVVGNLLGAISVSFLDRFTLFDYHFDFSATDTLWITALALATCASAAIYPAVSATRIPAAESLHYE